VIKGIRFAANGEREAWIEATYDSAEEAVDALDALRAMTPEKRSRLAPNAPESEGRSRRSKKKTSTVSRGPDVIFAIVAVSQLPIESPEDVPVDAAIVAANDPVSFDRLAA
jgi:hypothetical protein